MSVVESPAERPIGLVTGTAALLPDAFERAEAVRERLLQRFAQAGYRPLRTPLLEPTELHERTSGARIVSKLFRLGDARGDRPCLRPEWTAGIVRTLADLDPHAPLPRRVSYAGPVFRQGADGLVEFNQVGVELLGAPLPAADGEVIWLADWAASEVGLGDVRLRIGHIGVILEMLRHSGLPEPIRLPLVERLSEAVGVADENETGDRVVEALERYLAEWTSYLNVSNTDEAPALGSSGESLGIEDLFNAGRRSGKAILERRARKWDLGHSLSDALRRFQSRVHLLADLRGPATAVLQGLSGEVADVAPDSVAKLGALIETLRVYGIDPERVELDLGFGRGIGFYSQMVFELLAPTPSGLPITVCGGGRYDGLAQALGGRGDARGVGFSFGLERTVEALDAQGKSVPPTNPAGVLVLAINAGAIPEAIGYATRLRSGGEVAVLKTEGPLDEALRHAEALNLARVAAIGGADGPRIHEVGLRR